MDLSAGDGAVCGGEAKSTQYNSNFICFAFDNDRK